MIAFLVITEKYFRFRLKETLTRKICTTHFQCFCYFNYVCTFRMHLRHVHFTLCTHHLHYAYFKHKCYFDFVLVRFLSCSLEIKEICFLLAYDYHA